MHRYFKAMFFALAALATPTLGVAQVQGPVPFIPNTWPTAEAFEGKKDAKKRLSTRQAVTGDKVQSTGQAER